MKLLLHLLTSLHGPCQTCRCVTRTSAFGVPAQLVDTTLHLFPNDGSTHYNRSDWSTTSEAT
jgi:hypothetical protein